MTADDAADFLARLDLVAELLAPDRAIFSPEKGELYFRALADLPFEAVCQGLNEAVKYCTFMPKPAEIRRLIVGDDEDTAEQAWLTYKRVAREVGGYNSPVFADPALADTLVAVFGSWEGACWTDLTPEMWAAKRKEFGRVYRAIRQRGQSAAKALPGLIERDNALRGYIAADTGRLTDGDGLVSE